MEIYLMNRNFEKIYVIDFFISLLWRSVYRGSARGQLVIPYDREIFKLLQENFFIYRSDVNEIGIMEDLKVSLKRGREIIIGFSSPWAILERRVVWNTERLDDTADLNIRKLFINNILNPLDKQRKIPEIGELISSCELSKRIYKQVSYKPLSDVVLNMLEEEDLGLKFYLKESKITAEIYKGVKQPVVFSEGLDNIFTSDFTDDTKGWRNVCLVCGQGQGSDRIKITLGDLSFMGIDRREAAIDARDIQLAEASDIQSALRERGEEKLNGMKRVVNIEASVDPFGQKRFRRDYFLGDILTVEDSELGISQEFPVSSVDETFEAGNISMRIAFGDERQTVSQKIKGAVL